MQHIGKANIEIKENLDEELKSKIVEIFDELYGKRMFIKQKGNFEYEGDRGCLGVFGCGIIRKLKEKDLLKYVKKYDIIDLTTGEKEDYLYGE